MVATSVVVTVNGLQNICDAGADRLRAIYFAGPSDGITHSTVTGINQGSSDCQEGNAIEVRNFGESAQSSVVELARTHVIDCQKTIPLRIHRLARQQLDHRQQLADESVLGRHRGAHLSIERRACDVEQGRR